MDVLMSILHANSAAFTFALLIALVLVVVYKIEKEVK